MLLACLGLGGPAPAQGPDELGSARDLLAQHRWTEAETVLRRIVATRRNDAEAQILLGQTLKRTGKVKEATALLEQVVEAQPRHRLAREALGGAYLLGREPQKAALQLGQLRQLCAGACPEYRSLAEAVTGYSP